MKIIFYIQNGLKYEQMYQNECCHHFYYETNMKSDYVYHIENKANEIRLRKIINYDLFFGSESR